MTLVNFRLVFFAVMLTIGFSPLAAQLARILGLMDRPGTEPHKRHDQPIPLAGGLVISAILFVLAWAFGLFDLAEIHAILLSGLVVLCFGVWDDKFRLSPLWKLTGQLIAAILLVNSGVRIQLFRLLPLDTGLTVLWVIGVTNAFNFVDSMDGLASGLAGVASGFFMLVAFDSKQLPLSELSAILAGVCAGVYYFSALPARYFLGDSGAQFLGFILGALAIAYNPLGFLPTQSWYIPIMLVGIPLFDTVLVVVSRLRRGMPVYQSGLDHTFHRLVALGMHPNRAVLTMHFGALLLGCLAFIALSLPPLWANLIFFACLAAGMVGLIFLEKWFKASLA